MRVIFFRFTYQPSHLGSLLQGLGPLPRNIPSVSGLLLFNTSENPYKHYVLMDPLVGVVSGTQNAVSEKRNLQAAPSSILKGEQYTQIMVCARSLEVNMI